jgi:Leucine-rich repeat (LRR) protein
MNITWTNRFLLTVVAMAFLAFANSAVAQACYQTSIVSPSPFKGNNGEIFKVADGSIWEIKYAYEYMYLYRPSAEICPTAQKLKVNGKILDIKKIAAANQCYSSSITSPTPFMGNKGELFKLSDGSIWEVGFEYEYLYEYYPTVDICPSIGLLIVKSKALDVAARSASPLLPSNLTGLTASDGLYSDKVLLTWNVATGATSYEIYYSSTLDGTRTLLGETAGLTMTITGGTPGTAYYYFVFPKNSVGTSTGLWDTGYVALPVPDQREALVAIYNSANGNSWKNKSNWLGDIGTECNWHGVICTNGRVTGLFLYNNNLNGKISPEIGNLTSITSFIISGNPLLVGSIPPEIGKLTEITSIDLADNGLSGSIPEEVGNLTNLEHLVLKNNHLSGGIPPVIGNLAHLKTLWLSDNRLTGSIPAELENLPKILSIYLSNNHLDGNIPSQLGNLKTLAGLTLDKNNLTGSIPIELGKLANLTFLELGDNQLTGSVPSELLQLSKLIGLELQNNHLSGTVPTGLDKLPALKTYNISGNNFPKVNVPISLAITSNGSATLANFQLWATLGKSSVIQNYFHLGDDTFITGTANPHEADIGKAGKVFIVIRTTTAGISTWVYRDLNGDFHTWNGIITDLQPAYEVSSLKGAEEFEIYTGKLSIIAIHHVFIGYQRTDSDVLHYSLNPLVLELSN